MLLYCLLSAFDLQTTRIKGIIPKGLEVELELLGVKGTVKATPASDITKADLICDPESVELLAAVAQIDVDQTPPCCLEIAQLCGRCESMLVSIYI